MAVAGIDIGKHILVVALDTGEGVLEAGNDPAGWDAIARWLRDRQVERVGVEPSGIYGKKMQAALEEAGFAILVQPPGATKAYAKLKGIRAKNDRIDAQLIARIAAGQDTLPRQTDPRIEALREQMRYLEQVEDDMARWKTRLEAYQGETWRERVTANVTTLRRERDRLRADLVAALRSHADLARRLDLILSIPGIGERTALALVVHLPELGTLTREGVAALTGVAPYDHDSGTRKGLRCIGGGRASLRKALYAAALPAAFQWNPELKALYTRLTGRGKHHKIALIACVRKLVICANAVVKRGTPWTKTQASA